MMCLLSYTSLLLLLWIGGRVDLVLVSNSKTSENVTLCFLTPLPALSLAYTCKNEVISVITLSRRLFIPLLRSLFSSPSLTSLSTQFKLDNLYMYKIPYHLIQFFIHRLQNLNLVYKIIDSRVHISLFFILIIVIVTYNTFC